MLCSCYTGGVALPQRSGVTTSPFFSTPLATAHYHTALCLSQVAGVVLDVLVDEGGNEVVAVVVAGLESHSRRDTRRRARFLQPSTRDHTARTEYTVTAAPETTTGAQ